MKLIKSVELSVDLVEQSESLTGKQIVNNWECEAAKRASMNLRTLLFEDAMIELLKDQLTESEKRNSQYSLNSNGDFNYGQLTLVVKGVTSEALFATVRKSFDMAKATGEELKQNLVNSLFTLHPEHYATGGGCIESMGGIATFTNPVPCPIEQAPIFVQELADDSYTIRMAGAGPLKDGTPFTYVLQQYKDTDSGLQAKLLIWYPADCPDDYIEEHIKHYAVEFCNGCKAIM